MGFFETIYFWFSGFYDSTLWDALSIITDDGKVLFADHFWVIGLVALIIATLVAVAFYVWPINHPQFKSWWSWLIMLVLVGVLNFGIGWCMADIHVSDVNNDQDACNVILGDPNETFDDHIDANDYLGFALSNLLVSCIFFSAVSIPLMFYKGSARLSPFRA